MQNLMIDIETYSGCDLKKSGVYKYAEDKDFRVLLFGYSLNGSPVKVVDIESGEKIPDEIVAMIKSDQVLKWAYNSIFERVCLSRFLGVSGYLNPKSWRCDMVQSLYLGLPLSLADVGAVLGLEKQKMTEGKELIKFFCVPNKEGKRNRPDNYGFKWDIFKKYNERDVEVEIQIHNKLSRFQVPDFVWDEYIVDQEINDRGIRIDTLLMKNAIYMDELSHRETEEELKNITGITNVNSAYQIREWLDTQGEVVDSLGKDNVKERIEEVPEPLKTVYKLRLKLAKSSVKKYQAMENCICKDERCHGLFQFYGANHTGRFSGRLVQLQNLAKNFMPELSKLRDLVKNGDYKFLKENFESVPDILSELVRTALIPKDGYKFIVADFSAIEARVLSFVAGEIWRNVAFKQGKDIYCASASEMFGVPVEKHGVNAELRQKGKQAELACGYGGSIGAMERMGGSKMGLTKDEMSELVKKWRQANTQIVRLWNEMNRAAVATVKTKLPHRVKCMEFYYEAGILFLKLPSGRTLAYVKPKLITNKFGMDGVEYQGVDGTRRFTTIDMYGGKWVENAIQAISRDILCFTLKNLKNYRVVAHIHDEVIVEVPMDTKVEEITNIMSKSPEWMPDLILTADGFETMFYMKEQ